MTAPQWEMPLTNTTTSGRPCTTTRATTSGTRRGPYGSRATAAPDDIDWFPELSIFSTPSSSQSIKYCSAGAPALRDPHCHLVALRASVFLGEIIIWKGNWLTTQAPKAPSVLFASFLSLMWHSHPYRFLNVSSVNYFFHSAVSIQHLSVFSAGNEAFIWLQDKPIIPLAKCPSPRVRCMHILLSVYKIIYSCTNFSPSFQRSFNWQLSVRHVWD